MVIFGVPGKGVKCHYAVSGVRHKSATLRLHDKNHYTKRYETCMTSRARGSQIWKVGGGRSGLGDPG